MAREIALVTVLAVLSTVSWCLRDDDSRAAQPPVAAIGAQLPSAGSAIDRAHQLELPDGTFVAALNGAIDPAPLAQHWGDRAWSPILGVERSAAGFDWYRHADGSFSTTQMIWRPDLGRHTAITRVAHPPAAGDAVAAK